MIRSVKPQEWGRVEGLVADMPWLVAEERFISFFKDPRRGSRLYEHVKEKHGCFASNATDWANATNSVIAILNTLPNGASEHDVISAFALQDC